MGNMTTTPFEPARDTTGRFATQDHTAPELVLGEQYLDDDSDGSEFDMHAFYDTQQGTQEEQVDSFDEWIAGQGRDTPGQDHEDAFTEWLEEFRTPQGMDEYFDRPNPALAVVGPGEQLEVGAWGNAQPF